jgi:hypothetical protein
MLRKVLIGVNTSSVPRLTVGVTVEAPLRRLNDDLEGVAFAGIVSVAEGGKGQGDAAYPRHISRRTSRFSTCWTSLLAGRL